MIRILALLPNDQAVISTKGLYRIVERPSGEIKHECLDKDEAFMQVEVHARCSRDTTEVPVEYDDLYTSGEFDRDYHGLASPLDTTPRVLAVIDGCVVVESKGLRRVVLHSGDDKHAQPIGELLTKGQARRLAEKYERGVRGGWVGIAKYKKLDFFERLTGESDEAETDEETAEEAATEANGAAASVEAVA
jgi:hypothetical protein